MMRVLTDDAWLLLSQLEQKREAQSALAAALAGIATAGRQPTQWEGLNLGRSLKAAWIGLYRACYDHAGAAMAPPKLFRDDARRRSAAGEREGGASLADLRFELDRVCALAPRSA